MRIVIDMQGAQTESRFRGIGRYTMSIAQAIVRNCGEHEVILALNGMLHDTIDPVRDAFRGLLPENNICVWHAIGPVRERDPFNSWRREVAEFIREAFLEALEPDVIFVPSVFEGFVDDAVTSVGAFATKVPTVATIHDLIPLQNPEAYLISNQPYKQYYFRKVESIKRASAWIAVSESSKSEACAALSLDETLTINGSEGCDPVFQQVMMSSNDQSSFLGKFKLSRPFVLYSGGADGRKNLPRLIRAYAGLPKQLRVSHQLVMAGRMPKGDVEVLRRIAKKVGLGTEELVFTGYVSDEELARLYTLCKLFAFPSWHEGFGLPALEAMSCSSAVIGANTSSLPEVIGSPDALFDPYNEDDIKRLLTKALSDQDFLNQLRQHSLQQARKFSWDTSACRILEVLEHVAAVESEHSGSSKSWADILTAREARYKRLIEAIGTDATLEQYLTEYDIKLIAALLAKNESQVDRVVRATTLPSCISWRIEGPFDSTYSLALLNRETARAMHAMGHDIALHSTEGHGDFSPNSEFIKNNPDIARLHNRSFDLDELSANVSSRNLYPPRVADMRSRVNLLHHYAWEESGFPMPWIDDFNLYLQGVTCLSTHVQKILVDHGLTVPCAVSGCGVDHWERIEADVSINVRGKGFRFLHVSSCFPRKGADILLKAYGQAFNIVDDVTLVIKTFPNPHNEIHRWLEEARAGKPDFPDVEIIEGDLTDSQLKGVYEQCHALVAPSKAEGFGLPMAEAMLSGLPVITTAWGGQSDFCTSTTSWLVDYTFERAQTHFGLFNSVWAVPDIEHLTSTLREVFNTPAVLRQSRAQQGRDLLLSNFRWSDVVKRLVEACRSWAQAPLSSSPRIGWVTTWNTRCGIATYSAHLIERMPCGLTIFAANTAELTEKDQSNVVRCWDAGDHEDLETLSKGLEQYRIETVVIQFNYGFFDLGNLAFFLNEQLNSGKQVVIAMHATIDPAHAQHKKLIILREVLSRCQRILVHTPADLNRLKNLGLVDNVVLFPHGIKDYQQAEVKTIQQGMTEDKIFTVASYGFFLPHKGLLELIEAIALLRKAGRRVRLKMVNSEYPAPESAELVRQAKQRVAEIGLEYDIDIITDFLADEESLSLLAQSDLIVYPYQITGESASGAVRYGLASGRPVAVTPLSIFDDVAPVVFRLPGTSPEEIADGIALLMDQIGLQSAAIQEKGTVATRWREEHRYDRLGHRLYGMLQALSHQTAVD